MILAGLMSVGAITMSKNDKFVTKSVNVSNSVVAWKGQKVLGSHTGFISLKSGDLQFSEVGSLAGGQFAIDMTTITNTDLKGDTAAKLIGHLKSDDFFGVANHPVATFKITKIVSKGTPGDYKVIGELTIKDITKEIKFEANITDSQATASITVDRSDFNVRYGSGTFFSNLGDKTIYDEFDLDITLIY